MILSMPSDGCESKSAFVVSTVRALQGDMQQVCDGL